MMGLIFWMSSRPAPEAVQKWPIFGVIKLSHLAEYGFLTLLWVWGLRHATNWSLRKVAMNSVLITVLWGISDEFHQSFVPERTAKLADVFTDLLAALAVSSSIFFICGRKAKLCYKSAFKKDEEVL